MLLYLFAVQSLALAVTHLVSSRHLAAGLTGLAVLCLSLASGVTVHHEEVGVWASWLRYASPTWWMSHPLLQDELGPVGQVRCSRNPVATEKLIVVKIPCGLPSGQAALKYFNFLPFKGGGGEGAGVGFTNSVNFDPSNLYDSLLYGMPFIATIVFYAVFTFLSFVTFLLIKQTTKRSRTKKNKM